MRRFARDYTQGQEALIRRHDNFYKFRDFKFFSSYNLMKQEASHEHRID